MISMTTYSLIIKKILKIGDNMFAPNYEKKDSIAYIHKLFFQLLLLDTNKKISISEKYNFFYYTINNFLMPIEYLEEFINYFCKIQRTYKLLNSFIAIYKYKKAKIVVNVDMCLNEININDKNVICILHYNSKYLFHINDLINIINTALTNSRNFFSEPVSIKNPYNNLPFEKSTLYNIYFYIKYHTHFQPKFFNNFFDCDFNLNIFAQQNEYLLREYIINNYVYKSTAVVLKKEIDSMLIMFNRKYVYEKHKYNIKIDKSFPVNKLIKIMQPYLLLYCISHYSLLEYRRKEAAQCLNKKLISFYKFNPLFGRKKYKIEFIQCENFKKKITGKRIIYDDRHILFNNIEQQNKYFLNDHLKCTESALTIFPIEFNNNNFSGRYYESDYDTDTIYDEDREEDGDDVEVDVEVDDEDEEEDEGEEVEQNNIQENDTIYDQDEPYDQDEADEADEIDSIS